MSSGRSSALPSLVFYGVLQTVFLTMKLTGVVEWSWWVVMFPLWITTGMYVFGYAIGRAVAGSVIELLQRKEGSP